MGPRGRILLSLSRVVLWVLVALAALWFVHLLVGLLLAAVATLTWVVLAGLVGYAWARRRARRRAKPN